jgi:lipopolysaccharide export system protein LptC
LKHRPLALTLLLALLLSLVWWIRELSSPEPLKHQPSKESPNAYAEQLKVLSFDTTGRLEQILITPHMEHYDSTNTSKLDEPVVWRFTTDSPPWRMQADKALAYDDEERVFLPGEVVINRDASPQQPPYHIVTRDLTLETATAHATTDQPVRIESGKQWITAIGMEGWFKTPTKLNLLNQVRAYYVFD